MILVTSGPNICAIRAYAPPPWVPSSLKKILSEILYLSPGAIILSESTDPGDTATTSVNPSLNTFGWRNPEYLEFLPLIPYWLV